jgi:hypothetical protein
MTEDQERISVPLHWHIFREAEDGGKQFMLPIYHKADEAMAAATALNQSDQRHYSVEECQNPACLK